MTFRRRLTLMVVSIIVLSIVITGTISTITINNYFRNFLNDEYEKTVKILIADSKDMILGISGEHRLDQYLRDPISSISIYFDTGDLLYYESDSRSGHGRMNMPMFFSGETDQFDIEHNGQVIGKLVIERSSKIQDSQTVIFFNQALFRGVGFAAFVALVFSLLLSRRLSKGITNDLKETAYFANGIESGNEKLPGVSNTLEIRSIQRQLVNLSRKLKVQNRIRKAKVDQIAHETKTPITILKSQLEGTLDGVLQMDDKRLKSCLEAVGKLQVLTKDISTVLTVDEEEIVVNKMEFDLMEELKVIQTGLALQFESKNLTLDIEGPEHLMIETDRNLLSVSLYNLIINALKFTSEGGVRVKVDSSPTRIVISDSGIGISEEHLNQIFEPYYRAVSKEAFAGDGLGLYITRRNVNALGAKITVKSQVGKGTQFEVEL